MKGATKIKDLSVLAKLIEAFKADAKTIVHCHGVFDLLHIGHIRYFEQARRMGDILVVTLTPDRFVDKGPNRPAFTEQLRAEAIASLDCVDYVAVNAWPTAEETLRLLRPDIYVKGSEFRQIDSDMTGKIGLEQKVVEEIGAKLAFTEDIVFSSSNLINRYLSHFSEEINTYLEFFRKRHGLQEVLQALEEISGLNVLVVGDTILDDYQYVDVIGKSSKDPTLAAKYTSNEIFAGGVLAVANHASNFSRSVTLLSVIGEKESHEAFIRSQLNSNVEPLLFVQPGAPTLIKRRYIDAYSFNKLFEVYVMDDSGLPAAQDAEVCQWLRENLRRFDLVIAADFGHGAISERVLQTLVEHAPFLAVNTQANAGNRGFNTISRYPRADFASIAEHELRLETRNLRGDVRPQMERIVERMGCSQFVVTLGRKGCAVSDRDQGFVKVPAFAQKTVDRVGAGDAFFAVTALAAYRRVPNEILGFIGNVVGSLAVEVVGNKKSIDKSSLQKAVVALMK